MLDSIVYPGIFTHENSTAFDRHVTDDSVRYAREAYIAYIDFYLVLIIYTDEKKRQKWRKILSIPC